MWSVELGLTFQLLKTKLLQCYQRFISLTGQCFYDTIKESQKEYLYEQYI